MAVNQEQTPVAAAATLLRLARSAVLATSEGTQPYASLVTPALDEAGRPILLLSSLAAHTGHLRANPHCALFIEGAPATSNPQTAPRLCLMGMAEEIAAEPVRALYLRTHPYAAGYVGFADFGFWVVNISSAKFIGGFAQAHDLNFASVQDEIFKSRMAASG